MNYFFRFYRFLNYQWVAKTKYYIHSPFVYQFFLNVLDDSISESTIADKYEGLIFRLVKYFKPSVILKAGNSIGITTAEIVSVSPQTQVTETDIVEEKLFPVIQKLEMIDLILVGKMSDAGALTKCILLCLHHTDENSILVIDGIYDNKELCKAWEGIKQHPRITLTIDVFRFGICFLKKDKLAKENFVLRY